MFEEYRLNEVPWKIEELYLELSRAYMQLVREKSAGSDEDKETVLYTIRKVLIETLKMFSTIAPFISEKCYLNMKDAFRLKEESISHYKWPSYDEDMIDEELEDNFSTAYDIITNALNAREKIKLGVRWPLKEIMIITKDDGAKKSVKLLENIIKTQINVKSISILDRFDKMKESVKIDFEKINRKYKKQAPLIIAAFAMRSAESVWKKIKDEGKFAMDVSGENIELTEDDMMHELDCPYPYVISDFKKGYIILNQERTDELEAEGYARELMRRIQSARKKAGMNKLDRIDLFVKVDEELAESLKDWHDAIKDKVGAHQMRISHLDPAKKHEFVSLDEIKGKKIEIGFDKV
jgi:isoleucyl-tRNA synthetase